MLSDGEMGVCEVAISGEVAEDITEGPVVLFRSGRLKFLLDTGLGAQKETAGLDCTIG